MKLKPSPKASARSIRAVKFIFSCIVIALIILSFFSYRTLVSYENNVQYRMQSNQMIFALHQIELEVLNAESGHRGYQLTRNPEYLEPYLESRETIFNELEYLERISLNASKQEDRIDSLSTLVTMQYGIIEEVISYIEKGEQQNFSLYEANLLTFGRQNLVRIQDLIDEIEEAELEILNTRINQQENQGRLIPVLLIIFNISALAVIIYVFFYIYRLLRQKTHTEVELKQKQLQLLEAERMVRIGNWRWDIKTNKMEWSDGLYQVYKKSPASFEPDYNDFINHIHPDDKKEVQDIINKAVENEEPYELTFRQKLEDGSVKHVHTIGNPQININGELEGYFGVTQDITPQKDYENRLLEQSHELKRSNQDLEQFAYVASHDLQEPLRKIRAFGNRLYTKYSNELGESGVDYIDRMQNAAERMQGLINDLLTFSRVSRTQQEFEQHNLSTIIKEVLEDLETAIKNNNARIEYNNLPDITCNFHEMKRLFQNIIGNAIKFRKPDVDPVIKIDCTKVRAAELDEEFPVKGNKQYYKISIRDNGIGFNKKYQERIFNIFQRLHGRSEYRGTGIGLAISRKIITNHEGFITARGEENKGAEFIILLPKYIKKTVAEISNNDEMPNVS
jgi:signal transduction histidine kinase/CHASE3 domain sensor protein